jgi:hypothetical protein
MSILDFNTSHMISFIHTALQLPCKYGIRMSVLDTGFRDPSKIQFLTALDHYKDGIPRVLGPRYSSLMPPLHDYH